MVITMPKVYNVHNFILLCLISNAFSLAHHGGPHYQIPNYQPIYSVAPQQPVPVPQQSQFLQPMYFMARLGRAFPNSAAEVAEKRLQSPAWPSSTSHWADVPTNFGANNNWQKWGASAGAVHAVPQTVYGSAVPQQSDPSQQPFKRHINTQSNPSTSTFNHYAPAPAPQSSYQPPAPAPSYYQYQSQPQPQPQQQPLTIPTTFAQAFPTGFEQFKKSVQVDTTVNPYVPEQSQPNFGSHKPTFNPYGSTVDEDEDDGFETEEVESEEPTGFGNGFTFPRAIQFKPAKEAVKVTEEYEAQENFDSPLPTGTGFRPSTGFGQRPERETGVNFGSSINHHPQGNSQSYSTFSSGQNQDPPSSGVTPFFPTSQETQTGGSPFFTSNTPVYHPKQSESPKAGPHTPQGSSHYGHHVSAPDDEGFYEYEEYDDDSFNSKGHGVNDEVSYSTNNGGDNRVQYVQQDYRQPIQKIYNGQPPQHEEEAYGGNYGHVNAYSGGYTKDKYDPQEYYNDDMPIPVEGREPQQNRPKRRQFRPRPDDEDEDGYYVPKEAQEEEQDEDYDANMMREEEPIRVEEPGRAEYQMRGGRYHETQRRKRNLNHRKRPVRRPYQEEESDRQPKEMEGEEEEKQEKEHKEEDGEAISDEQLEKYEREQERGHRMAMKYANGPW